MKDDRLFRFEVFCTSKQLGDALALLSGRVAQITPPQLVPNAKSGRGGNGVTPVSAGELTEMFTNWLHQHKHKEVNTKIAREFLSEHGRSPGSTSYLFNQMRERGLLKNVGKHKADSRWQVLAPRKSTKVVKAKKNTATTKTEAVAS